MRIKVLVADDESRFRKLISDFLTKEDYEVIQAKDGKEALEIFFAIDDISLVILDLMMPFYSGIEVCKEIRVKSDVPVLMLTALSEESDEVYGLSVGADEYIKKPFSYEILMARVKSLLRRTKAMDDKNISIDGLIIDEIRHEVLIDNINLDLSPKEYKLLLYLAKNRSRALSRDQILNSVWGYDFYGDNRTVDSHIKSLRSKLGVYGDYIFTIRGIGYKFEVKK